ncbi:hypothetical protein GF367_04310, partial [Candidatus Woesearchaeota archaeon]|nr:hypothetical protein [Candidatus Woesearchaeota archaeon]
MPNHLFLHSGEHEALARAECQAQNPKAQHWQTLPRACACTTKTPHYSTLAYTRQAHAILIQGTPEHVKARMRRPRTTTKPCKIERILLNTTTPSLAQARALLIPWLGNPTININNPEETYALIATTHNWYVTKKLWENHEDFTARKNQN